MFELPEKPYKKGQGWSCSMVLGLQLVGVSVLILGPGLMGALFGLAGLLNGSISGGLAIFASGVGAIFGGLLLIILGVYILRTGTKDPTRKLKEAAFEEEYTKEMKIWNSKTAIYDRLFYCFREDQVFDPETGDHCSPCDLSTLLMVNQP